MAAAWASGWEGGPLALQAPGTTQSDCGFCPPLAHETLSGRGWQGQAPSSRAPLDPRSRLTRSAVDPDTPNLAASQLKSQHLLHPSRPKTCPPRLRPRPILPSSFPQRDRAPRKTGESKAQRICVTCQSHPLRTGGQNGGPGGEGAAGRPAASARRVREGGPAGGSREHPAWSTRGH